MVDSATVRYSSTIRSRILPASAKVLQLNISCHLNLVSDPPPDENDLRDALRIELNGLLWFAVYSVKNDLAAPDPQL